MQILVTGAAGFIGSNLCKRLLEAGHHVLGMDNFITSDASNLVDLKRFKKFTFIKHDITKPLPRKVQSSKFKVQSIYHLACPTGVPNLGPLAEEMLLACSAGTRNMLELALTRKAKFLLTSSSEVYGDPQVSPQTEEYTGNVSPTGIRSPYEEGKRFAESLVATYVRKYKLGACIVRVFNTYGPGMAKSDSRVIPRFLQQAINGKPLTIHGTGNQTRTFCYVDDLVDGLTLVMKKGKPGEVYNLGGDREYTIADVAKLIIKTTDSKSELKRVDRPAHDHQRRQPGLAKIRKLGWQQEVTLARGLQLTISKYKEELLNTNK